ncbi:MAG TPA: 23S rRNA (uracil(1939)-C(5))-methyltransferase RlmD [Candidatus Onthovivens sp.]|nr:23S rRNA (uracil(1939)-C(5))-methyltransferase RlmD [Candidatus Onthovivens sp.]
MRNEIVHVRCVDFTFDGQGLCKYLDRVIFVPSLLIDEEADVEILYRKKDFDVGKIVEITKFSEFRIKPLCPCSTSCGGCSFQNLDYQKELDYKKKVALNTLYKIGGIKLDDAQIYGMDNPTYYRNKIQVPFGYDKKNRIVYGFYKFKSHDIVPIKECVIQDKVHVKILSTIKHLMESMKITAYNEDLERGVLRHCLIKVGKVSGEVMVCLVVNEKNFPSKNNFVKALRTECPEITTILFNLNNRRTNVILGEREEVAFGRGFISDSLLGVKFKISSKSFYQTNHEQCEKLYGLALQKAELKFTDDILDAYCGIGTIGLIAAKYVHHVSGIEIVEEAIRDAKVNAELNGIKNTYFAAGDATNYLFKKSFDCVFVDPPRKGLDENFLKGLISSNPKKIVYISCDVATLARDLKILKNKYEIKSVDFVDMFPRTYHIETLVCLTRKN